MLKEWETKHNDILKPEIKIVTEQLETAILRGEEDVKIYFDDSSRYIRAVKKMKLLKFIFLYVGSNHIYIPINKRTIKRLEKFIKSQGDIDDN